MFFFYGERNIGFGWISKMNRLGLGRAKKNNRQNYLHLIKFRLIGEIYLNSKNRQFLNFIRFEFDTFHVGIFSLILRKIILIWSKSNTVD